MIENRVVVISPVYNPNDEELASYILNLDKLQQALSSRYQLLFILVDDGSQVAIDISFPKNMPFLIRRHEVNRGKGGAIKTGIGECKMDDIIIYTDFDFPYGTDSVMAFIDTLESNKADIVVGRRTASYFDQLPFQRRIISKAVIFINSILFGLEHNDTQAGIKGLKGNHIKLLSDCGNNGFLFEIEFLRKAEKEKIKILDCEVELTEGIVVPKLPMASIMRNFLSLLGLFFYRPK